MSLAPWRPGTMKLNSIKTEQPETTALFTALQNIYSQPTTITRQQFRQFEPLFRKNHNLTNEQIEDLSKLYRKTFDFYKSIVIIESADNPKIVVTLPPVFTPVRTMATTEANATLVDVNAKLSGAMPLYSTTAFGRMADALIMEQANNKQVITEYRHEYITTVQKFLDVYSGKTPEVASEIIKDDSTAAFDDATWEFEE